MVLNVMRVYWIECDAYGYTSRDDLVPRADEPNKAHFVRQVLAAEGWRFGDGPDLCPQCVAEQPAGATAKGWRSRMSYSAASEVLECGCTMDTLCREARDLFHELMELQRSYSSDFEQEPVRVAFYEHRVLVGLNARGMPRSKT